MRTLKTQIVLYDDHPIFRKGLKLILEKNRNFDVIGEASNERELVKILKKTQSGVVIINLASLKNNAIAVTKKLKTNFPDILFILLANEITEFMIHECVINGAKGIIWKDNTPEQLLETIRKVVNKENCLNVPDYIQKNEKLNLLNLTTEKSHPLKTDENQSSFTSLTEREIEVVKLFAHGYSYKAIAIELHISPRTVESHKKNILAKLCLNSTVDLVKFAIKYKLIAS